MAIFQSDSAGEAERKVGRKLIAGVNVGHAAAMTVFAAEGHHFHRLSSWARVHAAVAELATSPA